MTARGLSLSALLVVANTCMATPRFVAQSAPTLTGRKVGAGTTAGHAAPLRPGYAREPSLKDMQDYLCGGCLSDRDGDGVPDDEETVANRSFSTEPPWRGETVSHEYDPHGQVRWVYLFPREVMRTSNVVVRVEGVSRPLACSVAPLDPRGGLLHLPIRQGTHARRFGALIGIPRDYPDSAVVVRIAIPHVDTLYAVVPIR